MKVFLSLFTLLISISSFAQVLESVKIKLESINVENVNLREFAFPTAKKYGFDSPQMDSLNNVILKFDSVALESVVDVIEQHGWLGKNQVGDLANETLFIVIQHAHDNSVREKYFPLLEKSAKEGNSSLADMANMKDRILISNGEKQLYGTQFKMEDGELVLLPSADPDHVNERREMVGLEKLP
jgi:hypothetical protein